MTTFADTDAAKPRDLTDLELVVIPPVETTALPPSPEAWHGNSTSYIPGLNALIRVFMVWVKSQQGDLLDLVHLRKYLNLALSSLDDLPPPLRWRGGLSRPAKSNFGTDVQMVNLYITQIHIRSFLLDQMHRAAGQQNDHAIILQVLNARQNLVDDMLAIVYQMPEDTLEANGVSLISKLRDIGLSLLSENTSSEGSLTNLDRLLYKLDRLDVRRQSQVDSTSPETSMTSPYSVF
jgi:hypothetical protein